MKILRLTRLFPPNYWIFLSISAQYPVFSRLFFSTHATASSAVQPINSQ